MEAGIVPVERRRLTLFSTTVKNDCISAYLLCTARPAVGHKYAADFAEVNGVSDKTFPILIMNGID